MPGEHRSAKNHRKHKKTLVSQGITNKNQGFVAMRALGFEPRTQGLKVLRSSTKSQGEVDTGHGKRSTDPRLQAIIDQWPTLSEAEKDIFARIVGF